MGNRQSVRARCESKPIDDSSILLPPPPPPMGFAGAGPGPTGDAQPPPREYINEKFAYNPGTLEELHKKCKEIFPTPFEGAKILINKGLNQGFQISHNITLSSIAPSGYRFGGVYVGTRMITPSEPAIVMNADIDPSGNLNAQAINQLTDRIKLKLVAQIMNSKYQTHQASADIKGYNWTASAALVNPNIFNESGIGVVSYLHGVTPRISLGVEFMHQMSPQIPGGAAKVLTASARYIGDLSIWSGFYGSHGLGVCYYRKMNEELQIGVEIEKSVQLEATVASIGYQFDIPKANFTMRGMVDSNWTVTGVFEKRLLPMPFVFTLCGSLNHVKNQFRIGAGFIIGG